MVRGDVMMIYIDRERKPHLFIVNNYITLNDDHYGGGEYNLVVVVNDDDPIVSNVFLRLSFFFR